MVQRDRIPVWIAIRDYDVETYESFKTPVMQTVNFIKMDSQTLMEVTGQVDTGYATIVYPKDRGELFHKGDRLYLTEPANFDELARDAQYEVTEIIGKRVIVVTAKELA